LSDTVRARLTVADSYYKGNVLNLYDGKRDQRQLRLDRHRQGRVTPTDNLTL